MATEAVLDASAITAFVTPEKHSEWVSQKLSEFEYFHELDLSYYEVANAIRAKALRKELSNKISIEAFTKAVKLMNLYAIHSFSEVIADAVSLSLESGISVYDGSYLALANKLNVKFLTLDSKLIRKISGTKYHGLIIPLPD